MRAPLVHATSAIGCRCPGAARQVAWAGRAAAHLRIPLQRHSTGSTAERSARALAAWFSGPVTRYLRIEAASGVVLLAAAAFALVWANSPWASSYEKLWRAPLTFAAAGAAWTHTVRFWVNEGLMTTFFLVVGLEIRRELHEGALSSRQLATLPVCAALGGMIAPALVFLAFGHAPGVWRGWAVPTATDVAFAVGVLALLGSRVPRSLRALLLVLAIIDDIGAVIIIAYFYSTGVQLAGLLVAALAVAAVLALERLGLRWTFAYAAAGAAIWLGLLRGGIHPTLAGVILAFLIPPAARPDPERRPSSPCVRLQRVLHPWVAYGVMPLFALANAGIDFRGLALSAAMQDRLVVGIACALVLGKPVGIALGALGCLKLRLGALPSGTSGRGILLIGCLGGIGFTMSIFIAALAFTDERLLLAAKLGILVGSGCSAALALALGRSVLRTR